MEKKHIERLYALLERAEREQDAGTAAALSMGHTAARKRDEVAIRYSIAVF